MMNNRLYLIDLYDIYSDLLSDKQKQYFEYYYFDNLSLGEISNNISVSRNGIYKVIKLVENKLIDYEEKLKLYKKNNELNDIIKSIDNKDLRKKLEELSW